MSSERCLQMLRRHFFCYRTNSNEIQTRGEAHSDQLTAYERYFSISKLSEKLFATRVFNFIIGPFGQMKAR